jgi:hypothetical protein
MKLTPFDRQSDPDSQQDEGERCAQASRRNDDCGASYMAAGRRRLGQQAFAPQPLDKACETLHFIGGVGGAFMPLTRGRILGYNIERMAFGFTMLNDNDAVECQISAAAMDDLSGGRGTALAERETQFLHLRETIESIASAKFDTGTVVTGGVVRIFAKDIRK